MSMRRFSVVKGPDDRGVIIGEGVEFSGESGGGRAVVMPSDPTLGYPTFYASIDHVTVERPDVRVVFIDDAVDQPAGQLADLAAAPRREPGADSTG